VARVVLTQPQPRVAAFTDKLRARGHCAVELSFSRLESNSPPDLARLIDSVDWVIAVSPASVGFLFDSLEDRWPGRAGLALVGPGSLAAVRSRPLRRPPPVLVCPEAPPWDAAALMAQAPFHEPAGLRCVVVRGDSGRDQWIASLRSAGAEVEVLPIYLRQPITPPASSVDTLLRWLAEPQALSWVFTQASTVGQCQSLVGEALLAQRIDSDRALVIHPRIAEAARSVGFEHVNMLDPGLESLLAALESA
jgi:uroporphyrinogen-III synthase